MSKKVFLDKGKMKYLKVFLAAAFSLLFVYSADLYAAEEHKVSGGAAVDIMSNYVWRGQKLSDGVAYQPSIWLDYRGFGFNLWNNYDHESGELTENDLTFYYGRSFQKLSLEAGYIYYALDTAKDTQEFYASASYDILLSPSATFYYDFVEGDGGYLTLSIGHSFNNIWKVMDREITMNLGAEMGINFENEILGLNNKGKTFTDLYNGNFSLSFDIPLIDKFAVSPIISYSTSLSNDAKDAIKSVSFDQDNEVIYGGASFSFTF